MPTMREKIEKYENLLHQIQACQVSCNGIRLSELIDQISQWSYAHRVGNGEYSVSQQKEIINDAFDKLGT